VIGEIMETSPQDVVLRHNFFNVKSVLDAL